MKYWYWLWPTVIAGSAAVAGLSVYGGLQGPVRTLAALVFLGAGPGMAFVGLLHLSDRLVELSLAVALSLAIDTALASAMLYAGVWSPELCLAILIGWSTLGVVLQLAVPRGALLRVWRRS